jgi:hypothetical protein
MNFKVRLNKLERITAPQPRDCSACGYPSRAVSAVVTYNRDPLPTCEACGVPMHGASPLGPHYRRIIVHRSDQKRLDHA